MVWLEYTVYRIPSGCCVVFTSAFAFNFLSFWEYQASILFRVCKECGAFLDSFLGISLTLSVAFSFLCLCPDRTAVSN